MAVRTVIRILTVPLLTIVLGSRVAQAGGKPGCPTKVIDQFKGDSSRYTLIQNATVATSAVSSRSSLALPGHHSTHVLELRPSSPDSPALAGYRYASARDWSKDNAISFWYHGNGTGKQVTVRLFGSQATSDPSSWPMTWHDEFDGPAGSAPDPTMWGRDTGNNGGWGNNELEYYTDSTNNAALDGGGNLVITARKNADSSLQCASGACLYTSARLLTEGKFSFQYGRLEARLKLPAQEPGMWPAFWTLGDNIGTVGWPQSGEIDVMENVGRAAGLIYGTSHGPVSGGTGNGGTTTLPAGQDDAFHTYTIDWLPDRIAWYVDGVKYHEVTKANAGTDWVFDHPFFILLNLAVGGDFGGPVGTQTSFPQSMVVDYVRVYQQPDTAERFDTTIADSFKGWKHIVIPFRSFTRSPDQPANAPATPLTLKEIWGWALQLPAAYGKTATVADLRLERTGHTCRP